MRYQARTSTAASWLFAIAQHKLADYGGGLTEQTARRLAAILSASPLPAELRLEPTGG